MTTQWVKRPLQLKHNAMEMTKKEVLEEAMVFADDTTLLDLELYGKEIEVCGGLSKEQERVFQWNKYGNVVVADVKRKDLLRVNDEDLKRVEKKKVLNLSDDGERWEGDVLGNQPFGWGVLYDSEGEKAYEGFRVGEVNVCYGTRYYSDIGVMEYEGEWCDGKRWGKGTQYNRHGDWVYRGDWVNDVQVGDVVEEPLTVDSDVHFQFHSYITTIDFCEGVFNSREIRCLSFESFLNLHSVVFEDNCFNLTQSLSLVNMVHLGFFAVRHNCFRHAKTGALSVTVRNCPQLETFYVGRHCFTHFKHFSISCTSSSPPSQTDTRMSNAHFGEKSFPHFSTAVFSGPITPLSSL